MARRPSATHLLQRGGKDIAQTFSDRWNFHHCLGALDGKHIRIKAPANCGSEFYNYKGYNSIVLLALVDGNYKFRRVEVGAGGASSDAQIWNTCSLKEAIDDQMSHCLMTIETSLTS